MMFFIKTKIFSITGSRSAHKMNSMKYWIYIFKSIQWFVCLCHINMSRDFIVTIFHRTGQLPFLRLEPFFDKIGNIHANEIVWRKTNKKYSKI